MPTTALMRLICRATARRTAYGATGTRPRPHGYDPSLTDAAAQPRGCARAGTNAPCLEEAAQRVGFEVRELAPLRLHPDRAEP